jgi:hypothetical protein
LGAGRCVAHGHLTTRSAAGGAEPRYVDVLLKNSSVTLKFSSVKNFSKGHIMLLLYLNISHRKTTTRIMVMIHDHGPDLLKFSSVKMRREVHLLKFSSVKAVGFARIP